MVENHAGSDNLLHSADCLEAFIVFKRQKNLLFMILVVCLLLLQASFYLVDQGYVKINGQAHGDEPDAEPATNVEPSILREPTESLEILGSSGTDGSEEANQSGRPNAFVAKRLPAEFLSKPMFERLVWTINFVNAVLILTATLYCLTLLFTLKVSMHGGLGGINHISRAFFLSLLMLVLLLPWQKVFGSIVTGAVFTPDEMLKSYSAKTEDMLDIVLYYLRFSGAGVLMLLLLILSQLRSLCWAKAILCRFEAI